MTIRLENQYCQWLIAENGRNLRFADKVTGRDWLQAQPASSCAYVRKGGWRGDASAATFDGRRLQLTFAAGAASARVAVTLHDAFMVFTVEDVTGDVDELAFVNIPTTLRVGRTSVFGIDDRLGPAGECGAIGRPAGSFVDAA